MIKFAKYAEEKFELLNKHRVFFTREQIMETVAAPEKVTKKGNYIAARKEGVKVVYKKEGGTIKVITFYPVKI